MYRIISLSQGRTKKGERFSNRKGIGDFFERIERYDANLIRFHFFFFFLSLVETQGSNFGVISALE